MKKNEHNINMEKILCAELSRGTAATASVTTKRPQVKIISADEKWLKRNGIHVGSSSVSSDLKALKLPPTANS